MERREWIQMGVGTVPEVEGSTDRSTSFRVLQQLQKSGLSLFKFGGDSFRIRSLSSTSGLHPC